LGEAIQTNGMASTARPHFCISKIKKIFTTDKAVHGGFKLLL